MLRMQWQTLPRMKSSPNLKTKLDLNDQQVKDMTAALGEFGKTLHALIEKEDANKEEDPNEFIKGVKQAQADYQGKVKGILTDKQLDDYNAIREAAIMDRMKELRSEERRVGKKWRCCRWT